MYYSAEIGGFGLQLPVTRKTSYIATSISTTIRAAVATAISSCCGVNWLCGYFNYRYSQSNCQENKWNFITLRL